MATEDFSPRYVGDTSKALECTFVDHSGVPHDLTGVNASGMRLKLRLQNDNSVVITGTGTWTIPTGTATQGVAVYSWASADVNIAAGLYDLQVSVPFPVGLQHFDLRTIQFLAPF